MPIHAHFIRRAIWSCEVGQTVLVFVVLLGLSMQDYKSRCAAVTVWATLLTSR